MQIFVHPDSQAVARAAADELARVLGRDAGGATDEKFATAPDRSLRAVILPAGRTPLALFGVLRERAARGLIDLAHLDIFQLDELIGVGPEDPRSFHALLTRELLDPIQHPLERRHLLDGCSPDPRAAIERHAAELAAFEPGGARLALLGLGSNGHIGFNEPGSEPSDRARVIELDDQTRRGLVEAHASPPACGMTLGLVELLAASRVRVLVTGRAKRAILARVQRSLPDAALPATWLHEHPDAALLADRAATGSLAAEAS